MRRLVWILALLILLPSCDLFDDDDDSTLGPLAFTTESVGGFVVHEPMTEVWRTQVDWESFYCLHSLQAGPICQAPAFDFETRMLIGVFWGHGYSGCGDETESIERIERLQSEIEVRIGPVTDLGDCEAIVSPRQVVSVARSPVPVVFTGEVPD